MSTNSTENVMIQMRGVGKWRDGFRALSLIDLTVRAGEKIVLCGPSGSRKSTLIRCINRLEEHQSGSIVVDGARLGEDPRSVGKLRRDVGMVFQHSNLFPRLTILQGQTGRRPRRLHGRRPHPRRSAALDTSSPT